MAIYSAIDDRSNEAAVTEEGDLERNLKFISNDASIEQNSSLNIVGKANAEWLIMLLTSILTLPTSLDSLGLLLLFKKSSIIVYLFKN